MTRRPTMKDVARLAGGVHPSTVSLALRNSPFISKETRQLVQEAAKRIGYRPDPLLDAYNHHRKQVLPHKSQPVVAFISDFPSKEAFMASPAHRAYWEAGREIAENLHCKLELFLTGPHQLGPERLNTVLNARAITCLVLAGVRCSCPIPEQAWPRYSAVKIESPQVPFPSYGVGIDHRQAVRLATERLRASGSHRIGLAISPQVPKAHADLYEAGYLVSLAKAGELSLPLFHGSPDERSSELFSSWISTNKIDAVLGSDAAFAALLAGTARRRGKISFACLDLSGAAPEMPGILPDHKHAGEQAVRLAIGLMRSNDCGPAQTASTTYLPVAWRGN